MEQTKEDTQPVAETILDKPPQTAYIAQVSQRVQNALAEAEAQERLFALKQRQMMPYAKSSLVPERYQGRVENCLIAAEMAERIGASILTVMQSLYIVHGTPAWSSSFAISCFNTCGRFRAIWYEFDGEGDDYGCTACTQERDSGRVLRGVKVTWKMAKAEGWTAKNGSKWKTMPELMFRYRAATFLIRTTAPELLNGMHMVEELEDVYGQEKRAKRASFEVVSEPAVAEVPTKKTAQSVLAAAVAEATEEKPVEKPTSEPIENPAVVQETLSPAEDSRRFIEEERRKALAEAKAKQSESLDI